jgi:hypothetical protein
MHEPDISSALTVAWRHYEDPTTTERERDAILVAMCAHMPDPQARSAASMLHHRMEARTHQMTLDKLLNVHPPVAA